MTRTAARSDGSDLPRCIAQPNLRPRRLPTGVPTSYRDGMSWLAAGASRHKGAAFLGLLFGWTGMWILLWTTVIAVVLGPPAVAFGLLPSHYLQAGFSVGAGAGAIAAVLLAGLTLGIRAGLLGPLSALYLHRPFATAVAMAWGALFSVVLVFGAAAFERTSLRLRGYRRLSQQEIRRIGPLATDVARGMGLGTLPRFAIWDNPLPNAWAHTRTIVLTTGLMNGLTDEELKAVLVHELAHWRAADGVGAMTVWACSLPLALMVNLGTWLSRAGTRMQPWIEQVITHPNPEANQLLKAVSTVTGQIFALLQVIGWVLFWPGMVLTRFVITPALAASQRRHEYEADRAVAELDAGRREEPSLTPALISAIPKITAFEGGRTGWEAALARTHPPPALRIERLEIPLADDHRYQDPELGGAVGDALRLFVQLFTRPH